MHWKILMHLLVCLFHIKKGNLKIKQERLVKLMEQEKLQQHVGDAARSVLLEELQDIGEFPFYGYIQNEVTYSTLVAFKDLAKYHGVPYSGANKITTSDLGKERLAEKKYTQWLKPVAETLGIPWSEEWDLLDADMDAVYQLGGLRCGSSIHASGVLMYEHDDVQMPVDQDHVVAFNGHNLEAMGYIKYDLLSVDVMNTIQYFYGHSTKVDWSQVHDPKVWESIGRGETDYVFQFGSPQMKNILRQVKPQSVDKLAEANALYRPGPIGMGMVEKWVDMAKGECHLNDEETAIYLLLKRIFGEQHSGILIFQEDLMKICEHGSGFTLAESDRIRKATAKKIPELLQQYSEQFISNWKYDSYIHIEGLGNFLPDDTFNLVDGSTIDAATLAEKVAAGEAVEIVDPA